MPKLSRLLLAFICLATSLPLFAQVYRSPETDAKRPAAVEPGTARSEGMLVAIDPTTGELRQPTAAEAAALTMMEREKAVPKRALQVMALASGGVMVELDDSFLDFLTARIGEDGHLHSACVHSDQVDTVLRLPVRVNQPLEEK